MKDRVQQEPPPLFALHIASPVPPSSSSFPSTADPPSMPSRNSLFDQDWSVPTPAPARSRSSTVESQFSTSSEGTAASSSHRSWMDVDYSPPLHSHLPALLPVPGLVPPPPPFERNQTFTLDKTPVPGASSSEGGFKWPGTPPSPAAQPPRPFPSLPPLPPPVPFVDVATTSALIPPSSPSAASTLSPPPSSTRLGFPPRTPTAPSSPPDPSRTVPPTAGQSSNPLLDTRQSPSLRLSPTPPYLLGEGRHASVYLASFTRGAAPWRLCAAKRLAPDRESQVSGLGEAFILAKLAGASASAGGSGGDERDERAGGSRFVLRLYGVRDERDGVEPPFPLPGLQVGSVCVSRRASGSGGSGGAKRWSVGSAGGRAEPGVSPSPLGRTFPEALDTEYSPLTVPGERRRPMSLRLPGTGGEPGSARRKGPRHSDVAHLGHGAGPEHSSPHSRLSLLSHAFEPPLSSSKRRTTLSGGAQTTPGSPASPASPDSAASLASATPTPRIDILLEYCPRGHVLQFARCHPELVDKARWITWAGQLASAVAWAHEKGVLHADIKPQNVMVAPDLTLRLADWGTSLFLPPPSSPAHRFPTDPHGLGTPSYSPPEFVQALPSPFGYSADVFPLALTLGTLLTGREPYDGLRAVERMLYVARGAWWEWEERRRLRDLEGDEIEVALSRAGSVRSTRSAASRGAGTGTGPGGARRRSDSVESVRSVVSNAPEAGPRDWDAAARSLLVDADDSGAVARSRSLAPSRSRSPSPSLPAAPFYEGADADADADARNLVAPARTYPGTATPVQYFLSGTAAVDVVPPAARDLLRRMASPAPAERPTAGEVLDALRALARGEGVEVGW
ncbi:hypothetical protein JCM3770_007473 [Rhodotorula araucariae]